MNENIPEEERVWGNVQIDLKGKPPPIPRSACFIDTDKQMVLVHDSEYLRAALTNRRIYIYLLSRTWPGWDIRWAERGYYDILRVIGFEREHILPNVEKMNHDALKDMFNDILEWFIPYQYRQVYPTYAQDFLDDLEALPVAGSEFLSASNPKYLLQSPSEEGMCVFSVKRQGKILDYLLEDTILYPGIALSTGPQILRYLSRLKPVQLSHEYPGFHFGMLIDIDRSTLNFWFDREVHPLLPAAVEHLWPGWKIFWHTKGLPYQYALTGRNPASAMLPYNLATEDVRSWLKFVGWSPAENEERSQQRDQLLIELEPSYYDLWKFAGERN